MRVTILSKDVGEVKDVVCENIKHKRTCEDMIESYIKKELGIDGY